MSGECRATTPRIRQWAPVLGRESVTAPARGVVRLLCKLTCAAALLFHRALLKPVPMFQVQELRSAASTDRRR